VKLLARRSAFTYKTRENNILVLEAFSFEMPKTKNYLNMLQNFSFEDEKSLLIVPSLDKNLVLSSRNLKNAKVLSLCRPRKYLRSLAYQGAVDCRRCATTNCKKTNIIYEYLKETCGLQKKHLF
jgi:ribosomal protein L4